MGFWAVLGWEHIVIICVLGIVLATYAVFIEPHRLHVHLVRVPIAGLAPELDGLRIVHLTDLHGRQQVAGVALDSWVAPLNPDLVLITGDLLNPGTEPGPLFGVLHRLARRWPVYFVTGNHEHLLDLKGFRRTGPTGRPFRSLAEFGAALRRIGIRVLNNVHEPFTMEGSTPRAVLSIVGVQDPARGHDRLELALGDGAAELPGPVILMAHSPYILPRAAALGVDLVFSGHTHGGQVCFPGIGAIITRTRLGRGYAAGLHRKGATMIYISRGIGMTGLPLRFLCRPELAVIELGLDRFGA